MRSQPENEWLTGVDHQEGQREEENSALTQVIPGVSTGALLNAMEDPTVFPEVARGDLYVLMARLRQALGKMSVTQLLEHGKFLSKMGKVAEPEKDVVPFATAPGIHIHFPGQGGSVTIGAAEREVNLEHQE